MKHSGVSEGPYYVRGAKCDSVGAVAKELNCSLRTLYKLVNSGVCKDIQRAIDYIILQESEGTRPLRGKGVTVSTSCVVFGQTYSSITAAAKGLGVPRRNIELRAERWGVSIRTALILYMLIKEECTELTLRGKHYSSFQELNLAWDIRRVDVYNYALTYDVHFSEALEAVASLVGRQLDIDSSNVSSDLHFKDLPRGEVIRLALANSSIRKLVVAYLGTNGKPYFYVVCRQCGEVLLLARDAVQEFSHGILCREFRVPDGMLLPKNLREFVDHDRCIDYRRYN